MDFTSQILTAGSWPEIAGGPDAATAVAPLTRGRGVAATPAMQPDPAPEMHTPDDGDLAPTTGPLLDGRYRLTELLGQGGSASVYRGTDLRLRRPVAVKIFHSSATAPATAARQRTEMQFLARLNHPNLVSIYDARVTISAGGGIANHHLGARSYLVMEFVDGMSLAQRLFGTAMTLDESATVGIAVANALTAAHNHGLVHRDVKPANILLPAAGAAKLTDFGIARLLNSAHLTITAEVMGTPLYLSPEQASGAEVGPGTDIYSLGLVLLECITGNPEFPGGPVQSAMARLMRDPHVPLTLPAPWPDLLRSMTSPFPAERPTADAVAAALTSYLQDRERSRTATTITTTVTPPGPGPGPDNPAIPSFQHPVPGASVAVGPSVPRLIQLLLVVTCGFALAVMTAVIALTATGDGAYPTGPGTTQSTATLTVSAPARSAAATPIPAATYRAEWNPAPAVTIITTETATATETTTTISTTSESSTPPTSTPPTTTSESPTDSTSPTSTPPTTTSESPTDSTPPTSTPPTTTSESPTDSTTTTDTSVR